MDYLNADFNSTYETSQDFLDGYSFETLFLEISCNMKPEERTEENILKHVKETLKNRQEEALEIIKSNLKNIVKHSKKN